MGPPGLQGMVDVMIQLTKRRYPIIHVTEVDGGGNNLNQQLSKTGDGKTILNICFLSLYAFPVWPSSVSNNTDVIAIIQTVYTHMFL